MPLQSFDLDTAQRNLALTAAMDNVLYDIDMCLSARFHVKCDLEFHDDLQSHTPYE
jgi:hypothetical protein